jgi:2'-5' RNA ligase
MRLFVAIDPGEEILAHVKEAQARVRAKAPRAKWARPEGLHLTLLFLGEVADERVDEAAKLGIEAAARHGAMTLRFEGAGSFGGRAPRVLWVGVGGEVDKLRAAQAEVSRALAPFVEKPEDRYSPHLTLARAGEGRGDPALRACAEALAGESFGEVRVSELLLYRSELLPSGARYTVVARMPLSR